MIIMCGVFSPSRCADDMMTSVMTPAVSKGAVDDRGHHLSSWHRGGQGDLGIPWPWMAMNGQGFPGCCNVLDAGMKCTPQVLVWGLGGPHCRRLNFGENLPRFDAFHRDQFIMLAFLWSIFGGQFETLKIWASAWTTAAFFRPSRRWAGGALSGFLKNKNKIEQICFLPYISFRTWGFGRL